MIVIAMVLRLIAWLFFCGSALVILNYTHGNHDGGMVLAAVESVVLGLVGQAFREGAKRITQQRRDVAAADVAQEGGPYSLYLRPFITTNELPTGQQPGALRRAPFMPTRFGSEAIQDIEERLAQALQGSCPLVALGKPGEAIGAGRIESSEQDWQGKFSQLAHAAKRILIVPFAAEGTLWEIRWLVTNGLLDKTVFLMPPESDSSLGLEPSTYWGNAALALSKERVTLPPYSKTGMLFRLGKIGGEVSPTVNLPFFPQNAREIRAAIERIVAGSNSMEMGRPRGVFLTIAVILFGLAAAEHFASFLGPIIAASFGGNENEPLGLGFVPQALFDLGFGTLGAACAVAVWRLKSWALPLSLGWAVLSGWGALRSGAFGNADFLPFAIFWLTVWFAVPTFLYFRGQAV